MYFESHTYTKKYYSTGIWWLDLLIILIPVCVILLPWLLRQHWPKMRYLFTPTTRTRVKVLDIQAEAGGHNKYGEETMHVHYVFFKTEHGEQFKMPIPESVYIMLPTSSEGILTHKGLWFIDFEVTDKKYRPIFEDREY